MGSTPLLYGHLRFISLVCHCTQLSPLYNPYLPALKAPHSHPRPLIGSTESSVLNSVEFSTFIRSKTIREDERDPCLL